PLRHPHHRGDDRLLLAPPRGRPVPALRRGNALDPLVALAATGAAAAVELVPGVRLARHAAPRAAATLTPAPDPRHTAAPPAAGPRYLALSRGCSGVVGLGTAKEPRICADGRGSSLSARGGIVARDCH